MIEASKIPEPKSRSVHSKIVFTGDRPEPEQRDEDISWVQKSSQLRPEDVYEYYNKEGSLRTSAITMCALVLQYHRLEPLSGLKVET